MNDNLKGWMPVIGDELAKPYFKELMEKVEREYASHTVYPDRSHIFQALELTPFDDVKVVIFGQDPYHGPNQAHGLSFSVNKGVPLPPSLRNIFAELQSDLGIPTPSHGYLKKWAEQGVLLLNTVLTVRDGEAHSHQNIGWETFTNAIVEKLSERNEPVAFILWGKPAQQKKRLISSHHFIVESAHPSPLSAYRGFFGSKPFSQVNAWLQQQGKREIDWKID